MKRLLKYLWIIGTSLCLLVAALPTFLSQKRVQGYFLKGLEPSLSISYERATFSWLHGIDVQDVVVQDFQNKLSFAAKRAIGEGSLWSAFKNFYSLGLYKKKESLPLLLNEVKIEGASLSFKGQTLNAMSFVLKSGKALEGTFSFQVDKGKAAGSFSIDDMHKLLSYKKKNGIFPSSSIHLSFVDFPSTFIGLFHPEYKHFGEKINLTLNSTFNEKKLRTLFQINSLPMKGLLSFDLTDSSIVFTKDSFLHLTLSEKLFSLIKPLYQPLSDFSLGATTTLECSIPAIQKDQPFKSYLKLTSPLLLKDKKTNNTFSFSLDSFLEGKEPKKEMAFTINCEGNYFDLAHLKSKGRCLLVNIFDKKRSFKGTLETSFSLQKKPVRLKSHLDFSGEKILEETLLHHVVDVENSDTRIEHSGRFKGDSLILSPVKVRVDIDQKMLQPFALPVTLQKFKGNIELKSCILSKKDFHIKEIDGKAHLDPFSVQFKGGAYSFSTVSSTFQSHSENVFSLLSNFSVEGDEGTPLPFQEPMHSKIVVKGKKNFDISLRSNSFNMSLFSHPKPSFNIHVTKELLQKIGGKDHSFSHDLIFASQLGLDDPEYKARFSLKGDHTYIDKGELFWKKGCELQSKGTFQKFPASLFLSLFKEKKASTLVQPFGDLSGSWSFSSQHGAEGEVQGKGLQCSFKAEKKEDVINVAPLSLSCTVTPPLWNAIGVLEHKLEEFDEHFVLEKSFDVHLDMKECTVFLEDFRKTTLSGKAAFSSIETTGRKKKRPYNVSPHTVVFSKDVTEKMAVHVKSDKQPDHFSVNLDGTLDQKNLSLKGSCSHLYANVMEEFHAAERNPEAFSLFTLTPSPFELLFDLNTQSHLSLKADSKEHALKIKGKIKDEIFTPTEPVTIESTIQKREESSSALLSGFYAEQPLRLFIPEKGVSVGLDLKKIEVPLLEVHLGKVVAKKGKIMQPISSLIGLSSDPKIKLWFTPIYASLSKGKAHVNRFDALVDDRLHLCSFGHIDLIKDRVHMDIALFGSGLKSLLRLRELPESSVITIPLRGSMQNVSVDRGMLAAKLSALKAKETISKRTGIAGAIIGTATELLKDGKNVPPPTTKPLPWEQ